jgi:3',5'-cyclic-AMP phosphodiesterase
MRSGQAGDGSCYSGRVRIAWATDLHLDHAGKTATDSFVASVVASRPDCLIVTGDTGESHSWRLLLDNLAERVGKPVYFVLGNHDYYRSTIKAVRQEAASVKGWLVKSGAMLLSDEAALVGHDGWGDGRLGSYATSTVMLNDYMLIGELVHPNKFVRLRKLEALGDETADHFRQWVPAAAQRRKRIFVATHVPPFRDACWHQGSVSDDNWLPHFSCRASGDALLAIADEFEDVTFTVLCGHTHGEGYVRMRPNLEVFTGGAEYGFPKLQRVFEV